MKRVFGITGWKNSGKTTLAERLIAELARRGYRISTIKHAHHRFDIDHPGTDSFRHRSAGATEVAISSSQRWAIVSENGVHGEPSLDDMISRLSPCDLVLVEGYKNEPFPKIEVRSSATRSDTGAAGTRFKNVVAIASDEPHAGTGLPVFRRNEIAEIADFVVAYVGLETADV